VQQKRGRKINSRGDYKGNSKKKKKNPKKKSYHYLLYFLEKKKAAAPSLNQKPEKTLGRGGLFDFFGFFSFQPGKSSLLSKKMETNQNPHFFLFPC
jgi:hypothetical protein